MSITFLKRLSIYLVWKPPHNYHDIVMLNLERAIAPFRDGRMSVGLRKYIETVIPRVPLTPKGETHRNYIDE
jgi:hypothetical protein